MGITYRLDKDIPADKLIQLYKAGHYNQWWKEHNVKAMLEHCYLFVTAWSTEQLVGTVTVVSDGVNYAHIDDLLVHPSFQGQGIGTALIQKVLEKIEPLNLDFVQLIPIPGRESFFERAGFKVIPKHQVMELRR